MDKPIVDYVDYVRTHGESPKGSRAWMFRFEDDHMHVQTCTPVGDPRSYRQAIKWARAHARYIGADTIVVCP